MGELEFEQKALVKAVATVLREQERAAEELRLATPGGRFHVRWDEGGSATALGQLAFFAEFLEESGLFTRWVEGWAGLRRGGGQTQARRLEPGAAGGGVCGGGSRAVSWPRRPTWAKANKPCSSPLPRMTSNFESTPSW